jgi:hypothetical protein
MDFVERPGLRERQVHELKRADLESARLDSFYDVAREAAVHRVGLDNCQRSFHRFSTVA